MSDLPVHPVADLFPMLPADELRELAEDIAQRGLLQPIVLDPDGRVLDGRNRLAACGMAGIEPDFETYAGDDPAGYALAVNVQRRQLTKGQRAVVVVRAQDFSGKNLGPSDLGAGEMSKARAVVPYPDLADRVLDLTMSLNDAYDAARERKKAAEEDRARRERLGGGASDLMSLVDEERMSLADAVAALDAREEKARQEAEAARLAEEERVTEEERKRREQQGVDRAHAARVSDSFRTIIGRTLVLYKTPELRAEVARIYGAGLGDAMPAEVNAGTIREAGDILHMIADEWKQDRS